MRRSRSGSVFASRWSVSDGVLAVDRDTRTATARGRSARRSEPRRPSRRRRPRVFPRRPPSRAGAADRSSGQSSSARSGRRRCGSAPPASSGRRCGALLRRARPERHRAALGAGERRVRVAVDDDPVRALTLDGRADRRPHRRGVGRVQVEPVRRLGQPELLEEDVRTSPGPSADPCGGRPRRSRPTAARPTAAPT